MHLLSNLIVFLHILTRLQRSGALAQNTNLCVNNGTSSPQEVLSIVNAGNSQNTSPYPSPPDCNNPSGVTGYAGTCFQSYGCSQDFNIVQKCFGTTYPQVTPNLYDMNQTHDCVCENFFFTVGQYWQNCTGCMQTLGQGSGVNQTMTDLWRGASGANNAFCLSNTTNTLQTFISAWLQVAYSWSNFASGGDASYSEPTSSLVSLPTISPSSSATVATKIISATASPSVADPPSQNTPSKASEPSSADASGPPKPTNSHFSWSGAFDTKPSRYYLAPILFVLLGAGLTGR